MDTQAVSITEDQKAQFLEAGFIRLDHIVTADELAWLGTLYDRCFAVDETAYLVHRQNLGGTDEQGRLVLPQVLNPSQNLPELREWVYIQRIRQIARYILGETADFRSDHMILKPAGYGKETPWHQDQAYHDPAYYYANINFWLPLEGATLESGCMHYVPGSHHGVVLPHNAVEREGATALEAAGQEYWQQNSVAVPCPAGSVVLHHSYTLHYAGANTSSAHRRAYITVFAKPPIPRQQPLVFPWRTAN